MAWIESHQSLQHHRKTIRAAGLLKISRPPLIGHLHCLWWWAIDNADSDGRLGKMSDAEIAEAAEWPIKRAKRLVDALVEVGFLEVDEDGSVNLHDWYDYAGKLNEQRRANAERMRAARAARDPSKGRERAAHVQRTTAARADHVHDRELHACGATGPDRTGPDRTGPETPRVAPPSEPKHAQCDAADAAASPSAPPPDAAPIGRVRSAPKPSPRRDRFAETLDAIKALDPELVIGGDRSRNARAVNESMAAPALIAGAYVALMHGEWQDDLVARRGSIHAVVDNIGGYVNAMRRPAPTRSNGFRATAPPGDPPLAGTGIPEFPTYADAAREIQRLDKIAREQGSDAARLAGLSGRQNGETACSN